MITKQGVYEEVLKLHEELKRPVHIADLKKAFRVLEKRDSKRNRNGDGPIIRIKRSLHRLFHEGKISRTENLIRVENYPASPYSSDRKSVTTNVYFYAPIHYSGNFARFYIDEAEFSEKFISHDMLNGEKEITKKKMVLEVLKKSERALTTNEVLEKINKKYNAYDVSDKRKFYNATTSLLKAVLKPLRRYGLRGLKVDKKWIWFFTDRQLKKYKIHYLQSSEIFSLVRDLVKSDKCVPLNKILSELWLTPNEAKYHIKKVAKYIPVDIKVETTPKKTKVFLEVPEFQRDSFIDWLGMVVPRSDNGFGYETMLVDLESDWERHLKKQIKKSLSRIHIRSVIGNFYEKLVGRLFNMVCTSKELQNSELSKYMIPFTFRDEKVMNVWITTKSGRRAEFDVLMRGTFNAFNVMASERRFLDIIIPIESKYTMVKPEHVTTFDDKIRNVFGERRHIIPLMIGLGWSKEALHLTKRLGIFNVYFSAIDKLVSEMSGRKYRHAHEWKRIEKMMEEGKISLEELRNQLDKGEYKFLFEEYLEEKIQINPS